jgi:DNA primase
MQASKGGQTGMFSPGDRGDVERVKDASDIVRIIGEHLALKPKGREFVGLCPFHDDKTPSLHVVPAKHFYKCFSCGAAGDVLTFVQKHLRMEFREALEYLAQRAGIELTKQRGSHEDSTGPGRRDLHAACQNACDFFRETLRHPVAGKPGQNVITTRGISPEMVEAFQLGLAPDAWDGLSNKFARKFGPEVLFAAGLLKRRENGSGHYDTFRNRLIFPIADKTGRVIAFGARKIKPEDEPKYLNSPETPLFHKSSTLYALHLAARTIQETRTAIICEGYTDVIACHQAGFRNAVATLGTALTLEHARQLRLLCDKVVLLFDGDEAGQRAADRAVSVFFREPVDVHVATLSAYTDAKDPDELLKREGGGEVFKKVLAGAPDVLTYRFARLQATLTDVGPSKRSWLLMEHVEQMVAAGLANMPPVRQSLIVRLLASVSQVSETAIWEAIKDRQRTRSHVERILKSRPTPHEEVLSLLLDHLPLWQCLNEEDKNALAPETFEAPLIPVASSVHKAAEDGEDEWSPDFLSDLESRQIALNLRDRVGRRCESIPIRRNQYFHACLYALRETTWKYGIRTAPGKTPLDRIQEMKSTYHASGYLYGRRKLPRPR